MGNLGMPEMIFILVLALLLFGPKKLPEIGKQVGKALGEFKRASNDLKRTIEEEVEKATTVEEQKAAETRPAEKPIEAKRLEGDAEVEAAASRSAPEGTVSASPIKPA